MYTHVEIIHNLKFYKATDTRIKTVKQVYYVLANTSLVGNKKQKHSHISLYHLFEKEFCASHQAIGCTTQTDKSEPYMLWDNASTGGSINASLYATKLIMIIIIIIEIIKTF